MNSSTTIAPWSLRERYRKLLALYAEARMRGKVTASIARTIERKLSKIAQLIDHDSQALADSGREIFEQAETQFVNLVQLYARAVCLKKIPQEYRQQIEPEMTRIGDLLFMAFRDLFSIAYGSCVSQAAEVRSSESAPQEFGHDELAPTEETPSQEAGAPEEQAEPQTAPQAHREPKGSSSPLVYWNPENPPSMDKLSLEEYIRSTYDWFRELTAEEYAAIERNLDAQIEELSKKPEDYKGTKKAWLEEKHAEITETRARRDEISKKVTRYRNNKLTEEEKTELNSRIQAGYAEHDGVLTSEQRRYQLDILMAKVFEEESRDEQFFPTPKAVIEKYILPNADLEPGLRVLEPSAGKGDIADAVRASCPTCHIDVIEINPTRAEVLQLKGYKLVGRDALSFKEPDVRYDRILMNPPYLHGVGTRHVMHAFTTLLKPGGKLVAILNSGAYTDKNDPLAIRFRREFVEKYGHAIPVPKEEYNVGIERGITIDIAILVLEKPEFEEEEVTPTFEVRVGTRVVNRRSRSIWVVDAIEEQDGRARVLLRNETTGRNEYAWAPLNGDHWQIHVDSEERLVLPDRPASAIDTSFRPPSIITARPELTGQSRGFHVDRSLLSEKIRDYAIEGANYAIEALRDFGGFLLTDGTGTGKTIQQLLVAHYWYKQTGKPVLIFTESAQIIYQSFFGDAKKLGLNAPDSAFTEKPARRPANYRGLYDEDDYALYEPAPVLADGAVNVVRFRPDLGVVDGINVGTYNDLSNIDALRDHPMEIALKKAQANAKAARKHYAQMRRNISGDSSLNSHEKKRAKDAIKLKEEHDPVFPALILAEDLWMAAQKELLEPWVQAVSCLIYDEAHNLKNTGPGGSQRATRAEILSDAAPRVMFVTATPADKPGDILYLKRSGLYRNKMQFGNLMTDIGYKWVEERRNATGQIVRRGEYKPATQHPEEIAAKGLARAFDKLTEDRQMLKREIELSNLEPPTMIDVPVDRSVEKLMLDIEATLMRQAEADERGVPHAEILMEQKRALEPHKIDKCIELTRQELNEGRSVVIFADLVDEGESPKAWGERKAGVMRILKERLARIIGEDQIGLVIGVSNEWEKQERMRHINAFQNGEKRVILCTIGSGGTGISLDDTVGNAPRTIIIMTAPMNSIKTVQVMGRVVRANTKSRSRVYFLFADIAIDEWLKNLLATKLEMLGAMVAGQVRKLNPKEVEAIEAGGDTGAAAAFASQTKQLEQKKHSLFDRKAGSWIDGRDYPRGTAILVCKYDDGWARSNRVRVRIKGATRADLLRLVDEQQESIVKFGFQKKSDRYEGTYFECPYSDDAWTWALNIVKIEQGNIVPDPRQIFKVGDEVILQVDFVRSMTKAGARGVIAAVRPRVGYYLYDVAFADGTTGEAIEQEVLVSAYVHSFAEGQVYTRTYSTVDYGRDIEKRHRLTINRVHGTHNEPRFDIDRALERRAGDTWILDSSYGAYSYSSSSVSLDELELIIQEKELVCEVHCGPSPEQTTNVEAPVLADASVPAPGSMERDWPTHHPGQNALGDGEDPPSSVAPIEHDWLSLSPGEPRSPRSIDEVAKLRVTRRPLSGRFQALFGLVPYTCTFFIHGPAGHGKSSLALQFSDEIARQEAQRHKRVLYINSEQRSDRGGMTDRIRYNRVRSRNIDIEDTRDPDTIKRLLRTGNYSFVVIDSITRILGTDREKINLLLSLYQAYPDVSFMLIAHEDKAARTYKGPSDFAHDAEIWVRVEQGVASTEKNHFGPHNSVRIINWSPQV